MNNQRRSLLFGAVAFALMQGDTVLAKGNGQRRKPTQPSQHQKKATKLIQNSDKAGGHFNRRHVAKSRAYLHFRGAASQQRKPSKNTTKNKGLKVRRQEYSSFSNASTAQAYLSRALERNTKQIHAWSRNPKAKRLVLHTKTNKSAGAVYLPKTQRTVKPKSAKFVLVKKGKGYRLHTGYLSSMSMRQQRKTAK